MPPKVKPPPSPRATHFLCIPLVTPSSQAPLAASLARFQADVTSVHSFGVPKAAVRPLGTLHLTLGVMNLVGEEKLEGAKGVLAELRLRELLAAAMGKAVEGATNTGKDDKVDAAGEVGDGKGKGKEVVVEEEGKLEVSLVGLKSMQPAKKARVLYAPPVDKMGLLYGFCERVRNVFIEKEFLMEVDRPLLLHATVVNMTYSKPKGGRKGHGHGHGQGGDGKRKEWQTFDASGVLDRYEDYEWVEGVEVDKVQICKMGAKETEDGEDMVYEAVAEVSF